MSRERFDLILDSAHMIAPAVRHLQFRRADGQPLTYVPGQFLQVHFPHGEGEAKRSYSIANAPMPDHRIEIAVSYVEGGAATALFAAMQPGDRVAASGPAGRFCLLEGDHNARYLLIGTGTGVTPYRAMLPTIAERIAQRGQRFVLLFGTRTPEEILYAEDFQAFAQAHPAHFTYRPCLSRAECRGFWQDDRRGHVQDQFEDLKPDPSADIAYLCGNPNMVDAAFERLKSFGLPVPAIRREKYVSSR